MRGARFTVRQENLRSALSDSATLPEGAAAIAGKDAPGQGNGGAMEPIQECAAMEAIAFLKGTWADNEYCITNKI